MPPLTKLWFMHLRPDISTSSKTFQTTWSNVLSFCNEMSGTKSAGHSLWQDISRPSDLVFVSGYASQASTDETDSRYLKEHMQHMMQLVESKGIVQLPLDVRNKLPVDPARIVVELFTVPMGIERGEFEGRVAGTETDIREDTDIAECLGRWDVWADVNRAKKGLEPEEVVEETFVRITLWKSDRNLKHALKGSYEKLMKPRETWHLKKLMG